MTEPDWNYEQEPTDAALNESDINLRAYFDQMPDEKMRQYDPDWSDEQLMKWDGNFTSEGDLLIPCSESTDIDAEIYRQVLEGAIAYRDRVRAKV